jgi:hypothetical protein
MVAAMKARKDAKDDDVDDDGANADIFDGTDNDLVARAVCKRPAGKKQVKPTIMKRPASTVRAHMDLPTPSKDEARRFATRGSYTSKYSHETRKAAIKAGHTPDEAKDLASKAYKAAAKVWDSFGK